MTNWTSLDIPDQTGRTVLVTGANSGLGFHTSLELARQGARVLMACRNPERAEEALGKLRAEVPDAKVELLTLDLADLASVTTAAADVARRTDALDVLVANAGVMAIPRQETADGFEMQLGTNHLGHFALTAALLPLLLAAPSARVVVVSSTAHRTGRMAFDDLMGEKRYGRWKAYGQSKLANLLFVRELTRRAEGTTLLATAAHPGYAATNLQSGQGNPVLEGLMQIGNRLVAQPDSHGAWPQEYAATMPDVAPGSFWGPGGRGEVRGHPAPARSSARARNDADATRLWTVSEELTGASFAGLSAA